MPIVSYLILYTNYIYIYIYIYILYSMNQFKTLTLHLVIYLQNTRNIGCYNIIIVTLILN